MHPDVAWLVLACDLPFLDAQTLDTLHRSRAIPASTPPRSAPATTACPSRCAPSTSRARATAIAAHIAAGRNCPRKFLINAHTQLLDQPDPRALDNVNTVEEYERAMSEFSHARMPPAREDSRAVLRAVARAGGPQRRDADDRARATPRELYAELRARYPFTLPPEMLRVAVNAEFGEWSQPLKAGDAVVFIPPVAGG